jgi:hypothetical protein
VLIVVPCGGRGARGGQRGARQGRAGVIHGPVGGPFVPPGRRALAEGKRGADGFARAKSPAEVTAGLARAGRDMPVMSAGTVGPGGPPTSPSRRRRFRVGRVRVTPDRGPMAAWPVVGRDSPAEKRPTTESESRALRPRPRPPCRCVRHRAGAAFGCGRPSLSRCPRTWLGMPSPRTYIQAGPGAAFSGINQNARKKMP